MSMTEQMISGMVKKICGSYKIKYHLNPGEDPLEVDFTPPFRRVSMIDGLEEVLNVKLPALDDPEVGPSLLCCCVALRSQSVGNSAEA